VLALAMFGSFGLVGNMSGPVTVLVFSGVGWLFRRYNYSVPAVVIGILLGSMAESSLLHSCQISGTELSYILDRPVTMGIIALLLFSLFGSKLLRVLKARCVAKLKRFAVVRAKAHVGLGAC